MKNIIIMKRIILLTLAAALTLSLGARISNRQTGTTHASANELQSPTVPSTALGAIHKITFSATDTNAGGKIAARELISNYTPDWSAYNYLVLELRCTSPQNVWVGLHTPAGYNQLRCIFYCPGAWIRCAMPLEYFRSQPSSGIDMASTWSSKRPLAFINRGGSKRYPVEGVDSIGFYMLRPAHDTTFEIRSATLSANDPGDLYLGTTPAVDRFGQYALADFEGKAHSEAELRTDWAREDASLKTALKHKTSIYGGNGLKSERATGYFRTEKKNGRWWLVTPDGELFLSIGSNCVSTAAGNALQNIPGVYETVKPAGFDDNTLPPYLKDGIPYGLWNNYLHYGADMKASWQKTVDRMASWGMNTIGNWSDLRICDLGRMPFFTTLHGIGIENSILGMPDVYAPDFEARNLQGIQATAGKYKDSKMLVGYFVGNEPSWSRDELHLCQVILSKDDSTPLKQALKAYLAKNGDTPQSRKAFVFDSFEKFIAITIKNLRSVDKHHLVLGMRFAADCPEEPILRVCKKYFDIYSFNSYGLEPPRAYIADITRKLDLPIIIGEYHFGTIDRGLSMSLIQVRNQAERGIAYRHYSEQAFACPNMVGISWFQWNDQEILGRRDGENYNIGLVDVTDRPYPYMVKAITATAKDMYKVHDGTQKPYTNLLKSAVNSLQVPQIK